MLPLIKKVRKILFENAMRGEWWIDEGGNVEYADGDIGEKGHAAVVAERLIGQYLGYFDIDEWGELKGNLQEYENKIKEYLLEEQFISSPEEFDDDPKEVSWKYLISNVADAKANPAKFKDGFEIAWGNYNVDPREYGMKYLGWKRVINNWVQTMTLTTRDLKVIASGIGEIMSQNYSGDDNQEDELINIEVLASRRAYVNVPETVIKSGSVSEINKYRDITVSE